MTLTELIQRAVDIASKDLDTSVDRMGIETVVEPLVPIAFHDVSVRLAREEHTRHLLRRSMVLNFINGVEDLDNDVLSAYISDATLVDQADRTKRYSLIPYSQLVTDELDPRLGHFAVEVGHTIHVVEPNSTYDPTTGPTIDLYLTTPCVVAVPAAVGDPVVATYEVLDDLVHALAMALKPALTA
jgi:hypothetical protein